MKGPGVGWSGDARGTETAAVVSPPCLLVAAGSVGAAGGDAETVFMDLFGDYAAQGKQRSSCFEQGTTVK